MKNIRLLIFSLLLFNSGYSQYFRITNDTTLLLNSELVLRNSTKNKAGAFIRNKGNGITDFAYAVDSIYTGHDTMFFHRGDGWSFMKIPSGYTDVAARAANANLYPSLSVGYVNPPWITSLPASKITGLPAGVGPNSGTVAELRAIATTTGNIYFSTDRGGGTWVDEGLNDGVAVDDGAIYIITANGHRLHRQITGDVYPEWWGAVANGSVNNITYFNAAVAFCKTLKGTPTIRVKGGRWKLNSRWVVDGFAWADDLGNGTWTGIKVAGDGAGNSILDFSASTNGALFYGSGATNTLNAGVSSISIIGNPNIDGFTLISTAPYTTRNNHFDNLYFANVRDGINDSTGSSFSASNHDNFYNSPLVEGYSRYGIHQKGVYNMVTGAFIVHPNGSGANTLSILEEGQGNTYDNPTFEDQFWLKGYDNVFNNFKMEKVIKSTSYAGFFGQAFQIDGINNKLIGGKLNDLDNGLINSLGYVTGSNITISGVQYRNEEGTPNHDISNPIILEDVSSGVMSNVKMNTTTKLDREGFYERGLLKWTIDNVDGENGNWSKNANEIRIEVPPSGTWPAGVKAVNKTPLEGEPLYWIRNISGPDSSWVSSINSLDQIAATGNVTSHILISNAGMYAPDHHLNGNSANNISGYFTTLGTSAVLQATNFANNGGASLALNNRGGKVGIGKDPVSDSLDVEGTGKFSGNITTIDAVDSLHTPTYRQLVRNINSIPIQWGVVGSDIRNTTGSRVDVTGLTFSTNDAFFIDNAKAVMMKSASHGMLLKGATGSQNDYAVATPAGQLIIYNPTGSNNLTIGNLNGTVTVPTTVSAARATQATDLLRKDQLDSASANYVLKTDSTTIYTGTYITGSGTSASPLDVDMSKVIGTSKILPDADYTVTAGDYSLILFEPASARTLTLPSASGFAKDIWIVCRSLTTGRWMLSGSFIQKGTTGTISSPPSENFINSGLTTGTTYHLVPINGKWYEIND